MTEDVKIKISSEFSEQGINSLKNSLKSVDTQVKTTKQSFDQMGIGLQTLASGAITAFIVKAVSMGAELKVLRDNFQGSAKDLELFRKATAGTVSDGSLIQLSNYASDLGVALKDQALLFSLAEDAADKYGGSVESNFERVINASDGSARGLRAVGISTKDFEQELDRLIKTTGKHLDSMSAEEQQQIRLQAIFNLTGVTLDSVNQKTQDNKDKLDSLKVATENLTAALGEGLIGSISNTVDIFGSFTNAMGLAGVSVNDLAFIIGKFSTGNMLANFYDAADKIIDKYKQMNKAAELGTPQFQFQYSEEEMRVDEFGNLIPPKTETATATKKKLTSSKTGGAVNKEEEVKLTDELIDKQNELNKLLAIESTFTADQRGQLVFINYLEKVRDLKQQIAGLSLSADFLKITAQTQGTLEGRLPINPIPQIDLKEGDEERRKADENKRREAAEQTLSDTQTIFSSVSQTMSLIGITTDSFLGKLVSGFGTVLTIMESIKAVNSILSFIPGFASGGSFAGNSPMWVGEQGKELLFPNTGGYIMNHSDSMRFVNQGNSNNNVSVYLSGNIDVKAALKKDNKKYRYITIK